MILFLIDTVLNVDHLQTNFRIINFTWRRNLVIDKYLNGNGAQYEKHIHCAPN